MKKPIRILQIVPNMQAGGLETLIMNIYRNIDRSKIQFDFLVHYKEEKFYDHEIIELGGKIYRFSLRDDNNIIKYIKELNSFFKEHKEYKVIHCHMASIGALAFNIAKRNGITCRIAHSHNTSTEKNIKGFIKSLMIKPYKYYSTYNLACSYDAGVYLYKNRNFEILPNGIDTKKFKYNELYRNKIRNELGLNHEFVVGHVGRMCDQKNHDFLIDVFYEFNKYNKDSKLLLIGSGELEEKIRSKVEQLKLSDSVIFLGNKSNVNEYYCAMDCFVFPSKFEGLGIVLIEAQANGLYSVTSNNIPDEAFVNKSIIKSLSFDDDISKWANEINKVSNREKCNDIILNSKFDIHKVVSRLIELYINFSLGEEVNERR